MRRKDREMDEKFAYEVIDKAPYVTMSMIDKCGMPYCIPISVVRDNEKLYFHCAMEGEKLENLLNNNSVCISAVSKMKPVDGKFTIEFESAVAKGKAVEVENRDEKIHALKLVCERFTPNNMADFHNAIERSFERTKVMRIDVNSITGKRKKYDKEGKEMKWGRME